MEAAVTLNRLMSRKRDETGESCLGKLVYGNGAAAVPSHVEFGNGKRRLLSEFRPHEFGVVTASNEDGFVYMEHPHLLERLELTAQERRHSSPASMGTSIVIESSDDEVDEVNIDTPDIFCMETDEDIPSQQSGPATEAVAPTLPVESEDEEPADDLDHELAAIFADGTPKYDVHNAMWVMHTPPGYKCLITPMGDKIVVRDDFEISF